MMPACDDKDIRELNWYAIRVRSRHEFTSTKRLDASGINTFIPTVDRLKQWKDRKKIITFPLFPGYIFAGLHNLDKEKLTVLKTPGVVGFVGPTPCEPERISHDQVLALMKIVECRESIDPYPYLKHGNRVRIKSGPLFGVEGILVERKGVHLLVLSVDILKQGVSIQVEASAVETL
jgi:transcription termination/antitermination protein NusG